MTEPTLKERNLRFVVLKAIVEAGTDELGNLRADHLPALLAEYRSTEASSFKVRAPGVNDTPGPVVATVSLSVPKPTMVIHDQDEFLDWVQANHPALVDVEVIPAVEEHIVVVPATPERTERTLDPKAWAKLVKYFEQAEEGGIVDTATGAMVDGVLINPGGAPKSFAVKYENGAAEQLLALYRAGRLDQVVAGTSLPEVASRVVVERHLEVAAEPEAAPLPRRPVPRDVLFPKPLEGRDPSDVYKEWLADPDAPLCGCGGRHAVCPNEPSANPEPVEETPFDAGDWGAPSHAADPWG